MERYPTGQYWDQKIMNGMTSYWDEAVGNITQALKRTKLWENTLFVLSGEHLFMFSGPFSLFWFRRVS